MELRTLFLISFLFSIEVHLTGDFPNSDSTIRITTEKSASISTPGKGKASWVGFFGVGGGLEEVGIVLGVEVSDDEFAFEIPDLNGVFGGSAQPISVGAEAKGVDDITAIQRVKVLAFREIPQHGDSVLSSRRAEGTVWGNGDGVDVTSVAVQIGLQLALREVPHLNCFVPTTRNNQGVGSVW